MTPETNSYAIFIRDGILERMQRLPFFIGFAKFGRSRQMQIQPQNIPYAACYLVDEVLTPDGDANAGEPRFTHALRLGFSVIVKNNDPDDTENQLDAGWWSLMNGLLRDPSLVNFFETTLPGNARIEGFTRGSRRHVYGNSTLNNEFPIGELQFDLTCSFRTNWPPIIPDDLLVIHMVTGFPIVGPQSEMDKVQQVRAVYDMVAEDEEETP